MKISARVRANRANARRSSGPKTSAGKSRIARNAIKHGLAIPLSADAETAPAIERLARALAGAAADSLRLDAARQVAEAQIDLIRVRRARLALLNDQDARVKTPRVEKFEIRGSVLVRDIIENILTGTPPWRLERVTQHAEPTTLEEGLCLLAAQLARFDRYERRALSRRKNAVRNFDKLASEEVAASNSNKNNISG